MIIKYRSYLENFCPNKIKLDTEGWAGSAQEFKSTKKVQPFLCKPFTDANLYGWELIYPYNTTVKIYKDINVLKIDAEENWAKDGDLVKKHGVPIGAIGDNHFGINTALDIQVPENYVLRIENHPSFYSEHNLPCIIPGHLETNWWSSLFFIVCKAPANGETLTISKDCKLAQIFPVIKNLPDNLVEMTKEEKINRAEMYACLNMNRKNLASGYKDDKNNFFDNLYKKMSKYYSIFGHDGLNKLVNKLMGKLKGFKKLKLKFFKNR